MYHAGGENCRKRCLSEMEDDDAGQGAPAVGHALQRRLEKEHRHTHPAAHRHRNPTKPVFLQLSRQQEEINATDPVSYQC